MLIGKWNKCKCTCESSCWCFCVQIWKVLHCVHQLWFNCSLWWKPLFGHQSDQRVSDDKTDTPDCLFMCCFSFLLRQTTIFFYLVFIFTVITENNRIQLEQNHNIKSLRWSCSVCGFYFMSRFLACFREICSYKDKLCGLCGNYDRDANDDFRKKDGSLTNDPNDFGHSWNTDPE